MAPPVEVAVHISDIIICVPNPKRSNNLGSLAQRPLSTQRLIFDLCEPRADVLKGVTDADFAADLAKVIRGLLRKNT